MSPSDEKGVFKVFVSTSGQMGKLKHIVHRFDDSHIECGEIRITHSVDLLWSRSQSAHSLRKFHYGPII